jgi:hypothetical protein
MMLRLLEGFPDDVVAISALGRVTRRDYEETLIPCVDAALARHPKIRCYYELVGPFEGFDAGAAWDDLRLGIGHFTRWERIAIVTDVEWIRGAFRVFRFLFPGDMRIFGADQVRPARAWITAA